MDKNDTTFGKFDTSNNTQPISETSSTISVGSTGSRINMNDNFNIISYPAYIYNMDDIEEFKNKEWAKKVSLSVHYVRRDEMFIACPKSNLQEKVAIVSYPIDPIIFQYCPFGVLIYTMWGKETEDKVFEEYKKLRAIK